MSSRTPRSLRSTPALALAVLSLVGCASTSGADGTPKPYRAPYRCTKSFYGPTTGARVELVPGSRFYSSTFGVTGPGMIESETETLSFVGRTGPATLAFEKVVSEQGVYRNSQGTPLALVVYVADSTSTQQIGLVTGRVSLAGAQPVLSVIYAPSDTTYGCG